MRERREGAGEREADRGTGKWTEQASERARGKWGREKEGRVGDRGDTKNSEDSKFDLRVRLRWNSRISMNVYLALGGRLLTTRINRLSLSLSFSFRRLCHPLSLSLFLLSRSCTHVALSVSRLSRLLPHTVISLKLGLKIHYSQVLCTATRATDTRRASTGVRVFRAQGCCVRDFRGGR